MDDQSLQEGLLNGCMAELQQVLDKYNCRLEPAITIDHRGAHRSMQIVPNPKKEESENEKA